MSKITTLIDTPDNVETIRDQIAAILVTERDAQKALATGAGEDPSLWDFRVYRERFAPWSEYQNSDSRIPIVNVWFESETFDGDASNISERQTAEGRFNIDVYACGQAREDGAGHIPGDLDATLVMQRTMRLVRKIIMASPYAYLDLRGLVGKRWPTSITTFQPQQENNMVHPVIAARLTLSVRYNEFSPQYDGDVLEIVSTAITVDPSGEVIGVQIDFP